MFPADQLCRLVAEVIGRQAGGAQQCGDEVEVLDVPLLFGVVDVPVVKLGGAVERVEVEEEAVDDQAEASSRAARVRRLTSFMGRVLMSGRCRAA